MNERINNSLHVLSLILIGAITLWYLIASPFNFPQLLTILIVASIAIEVISILIIAKTYPESHTSFKIGIIAALCILLGIKTMLPSFFIPLTVTILAINLLYNFYANSKRKQGAFKRKKAKRLKL